jgi:uncharacterized membrane protein
MADNFAFHFIFLSLAIVAYLAFFVLVVAATRALTAQKVSYFRIALIGVVAVALVGTWIAVGVGRDAAASSGAAACQVICLLGLIALFCTFRFELPGASLSVVLIGQL